MNSIIKSVAFEYHWSPLVIDEMFCDDIDYKGLLYWYNELLRIDKVRKVK